MPFPSDPTITVAASGSRAPRPALAAAAGGDGARHDASANQAINGIRLVPHDIAPTGADTALTRTAQHAARAGRLDRSLILHVCMPPLRARAADDTFAHAIGSCRPNQTFWWKAPPSGEPILLWAEDMNAEPLLGVYAGYSLKAST
jgi:hypothetical protein